MTLFQERPIQPMMAKTGEPFDSDNHLFEIKWDGLRALLFLQQGRLELQNRNLRDVTGLYPEIQNTAKQIKARAAILDGEVVVLADDGTPDFGRMQTRFGHNDANAIESVRRISPATYVAFDLLHLDGKDIIRNPLVERKQNLRRVVTESPYLIYGDYIQRQGVHFYAEALKLGFEGIIAKDKNSEYVPGLRSGSWIKLKGTRTIDAIVVGYTGGEGARTPTFGSLVVAAYDDQGKLIHIGNVGGGFDSKSLDEIKSRLDKIPSKDPTLKGPIEAPSPISWVKPRIVCEVLYSNFTKDRKLRFPRFLCLRSDKKPEDCRLDEAIDSLR